MQNKAQELWHQSYEAEIIVRRKTSFPFLNFKSGMVVLDIGCGLGYDLEYLAEQFGVEGYGADLVVPKGLRKVNFVLADASHLPFKENTFNVVYSFGSIEHTRRTFECILESYRVLTCGGNVLHTVPNVFSIHSLFARPFLKGIGKWRIGLEQSFTLAVFHKMFRRSYFDNIRYLISPFEIDVRSKQFSTLFRIPIRVLKFSDNVLSKLIPFWGFFIAMSGAKLRDEKD